LFSRDGCIRPVAKRLRPSNGAKPRTTFEKKLSILNGEVFFIDKDLLMGADHEEALQIDSRRNEIKGILEVGPIVANFTSIR